MAEALPQIKISNTGSKPASPVKSPDTTTMEGPAGAKSRSTGSLDGKTLELVKLYRKAKYVNSPR